MDLETAKALLDAQEPEDDEPVYLPRSILAKLSAKDLKDGVRVGVGTIKEDGIIEVEWEGVLQRDGQTISGEAEYIWTRKYWTAPIGMPQYFDLIRRAVEIRSQNHGDVRLSNYEDDDTWIHFTFSISTQESNLRSAYDSIQKVCSELEETAQQTTDEIGQQISKVAARLSGWGSKPLDMLLEAVQQANDTDSKGRSLEELCSRLCETIPGFSVTGRVRTATEEIDISILNDSDDPRLRREAALILVECKNWTGKCGKDEFVVFREKLENRNNRCTLGFLISWNGFTSTVTKEMLRGSRESVLIIPMTGKHLRRAVLEDDFTKIVMDCWDEAVRL